MKKKDRAEKLADYLFANAFREKAERLRLESSDGRELGGWCKQAVVIAIRKFFPEPTSPEEPTNG